MAWLEGPDSRPFAYDFATSHDAHIVKPLERTGTQFIAFREADLQGAIFTVSLSKIQPPADGGDDAEPDATPDAASDAASDVGPGATDGGVDATRDSTLDGSDGGDATLDSGNDVTLDSADGGDAVVDALTLDAASQVTCTYQRTFPVVSGCNLCNLHPPISTITDNAVPILIDDAGGIWDLSIDGGKGRSFHILAPSEFNAFGCNALSSMALNGAPPTESWNYTGSLVNYCAMGNSNITTSITVTNGDQVNVTMHNAYAPGVVNCGIIHGCVIEMLDCNGTATANVK